MYTSHRVEKRRFQRLEISLTVLYQVEAPFDICLLMGNREFEAKTFDLAEGGVSIYAEHYLPVGTKLSIKLIIFEFDHTGMVCFYEPLEIFGDIRNSFFDGKNKYRFGVEFNHLTRSQESKLHDFIHSTLKSSLVLE